MCNFGTANAEVKKAPYAQKKKLPQMNITNIVILALFVIFKSLASLIPIPNIDKDDIVIVSK